jgi:hypothetical protein
LPYSHGCFFLEMEISRISERSRSKEKQSTKHYQD